MKWTVIDTIACPHTGIAYTSIVGLKMIKLVIWYEGNMIIPPDSTIEPVKGGILIDGVFKTLKVYNITTYKLSLWREMKNKIQCLESLTESDHCLSPVTCALKVCPYGKKRSHRYETI